MLDLGIMLVTSKFKLTHNSAISLLINKSPLNIIDTFVISQVL